MTANQFNAVLRAQGIDARLCRGDGYYYWLNANRELIVGAESVCTNSLVGWSLIELIQLAEDAGSTEAANIAAESGAPAQIWKV